MNEGIYVGIDPGYKAGAWATISPNGLRVCTIGSPDGIYSLFDHLHPLMELEYPGLPQKWAIENVHARPTDGVKSAFSFGRSVGWIDMLKIMLSVPYGLGDRIYMPHPQEWQRDILIPEPGKTRRESSTKKMAEHTASLHFPHSEIKSNQFDAVCLALYARHTAEKQKAN